jgi:pimeloyl-ACP methyl ester carboxylesterase
MRQGVTHLAITDYQYVFFIHLAWTLPAIAIRYLLYSVKDTATWFIAKRLTVIDCERMKKIVFVPGKNPKPHPPEHKRQLWRCLVEGVRRVDETTAALLSKDEDCFQLIAWNHLYYQQYKSIEADLPAIDALLAKPGPTQEDMDEAGHWRLRTSRLLYKLADHFPILIDLLPDPSVKAAIKETERYFHNEDEIADQVRELLKQPLREMFDSGDEILLIGHSMGSVIAWDSLWELWNGEENLGRVDLFLTLGSPLAMEFVRHRLLGAKADEAHRYTGNIRRWLNISSVGDLTALDRGVTDDFAGMIKAGLVESIHDEYKDVYNYFRNEYGLNVHRSYGYLVNRNVGRAISDWWRQSG